jgi:hypothetical protein
MEETGIELQQLMDEVIYYLWHKFKKKNLKLWS